MPKFFRISLCLSLLVFSAGARSQQATVWVSAQWTPMAQENAVLFKQADDAFKSAVEADYQRRIAEAKSNHGPRRDAGQGEGGISAGESNAPLPSGMSGPGEPRGSGSRKAAPPKITSLQQLLPASLDFAAPASGGLVLQRMSGAVVFGRTDSDALVMVPLSGEADLPHGMRGSIREEGDRLRLAVQTPSGQAIEFRYEADPQAAGRVMSVDIRMPSALPGYDVQFRRQYQRAQVNVGELKKAGG
jgi:hypothetical protein